MELRSFRSSKNDFVFPDLEMPSVDGKEYFRGMEIIRLDVEKTLR